MKNIIINIIANSKGSKMLRSDIFEYFEDNQDVKLLQIIRALSALKAEGVILSTFVPGEHYEVTEHSLSEDYKEVLLHI